MAPQAYWTTSEEVALIDFLVDHKAEAGDGCSFKETTFQKAVKHIAHLLNRGASKTAKSCGNKYSAVRCISQASISIEFLTVFEVTKALPDCLCNPVHLGLDLG